MTARPTRVALLVSPESFEGFYEAFLGLDRARYVHRYRNDFVWTYTEALREHGVSVVTYVPSLRHAGLETAEDGFAARFLPLRRWWWALRPLYPRTRTPVERYALDVANALAFLPSLLRGLTEDAIDVLYVQEYWTGRFDVLVRVVDRPLVAGEHGGSGGVHVHVGKAGTLRRARAITVQSTREQRRLHERYGVRAERVTNGVDTAFFTPPDGGASARPPTVLTVARLVDAQKRVSDLIRAVARLPDCWRLEVVGGGPDEGALRALAAELGVASRVTFAGWVDDRAELRERYRRCGVFALPSRWEAVTLAVLEAMACGAPVVLTPLRPFEDLIVPGENGLLVPPERPDLLAEALLAAHAHGGELGAAGRRTVAEQYDRRATTGRLATILHRAAGR